MVERETYSTNYSNQAFTEEKFPLKELLYFFPSKCPYKNLPS